MEFLDAARILYAHGSLNAWKILQWQVNIMCLILKEISNFMVKSNHYTVYCKLLDVEKFCSFCGLISNQETFPVK